MIDTSYLEAFAVALRSHHHFERLDPGLSDPEVDVVQHRFGFIFPPDLRIILQFALPVGRWFPDWRAGSDEVLLPFLNAPLEGILFDVEHNDIWPDTWGTKPTTEEERRAKVRQFFDDAPRLIPIYSHRYIPAEPTEGGNPVFSVHQTDIIHYGNDLADYFHREFRVPLPELAAREPRRIRFWDDVLKWRD